jgi:hypothetical protein
MAGGSLFVAGSVTVSDVSDLLDESLQEIDSMQANSRGNKNFVISQMVGKNSEKA